MSVQIFCPFFDQITMLFHLVDLFCFPCLYCNFFKSKNTISDFMFLVYILPVSGKKSIKLKNNNNNPAFPRPQGPKG